MSVQSPQTEPPGQWRPPAMRRQALGQAAEKDEPEDAGFPHLDTCDASSGQMHVKFSVLDLLKKIFTNPLMLMVAG